MTRELPPLEDELALIGAIAHEAGVMAMRYFGGRDLDVRLKDGESPVTRADFAVDAFLRETLLGARPGYGWLSEETPDTDIAGRMGAPRTFIADPIDGTRAFIEAHEIWCVSVALVESGRPVAGVLECPALGETIKAVRGGGAECNGAPIAVRPPRDPALIGGPRGLVDRLATQTGLAVKRHTHVPSLAYRLAMVARGDMDASFVKPSSADWDVAAADLIVHEAGGLLTDADGAPLALNGRDPQKDVMVACHPLLHRTMLGVVAGQAVG
ncbi:MULTISPECIES: 3'(2'),5'-bisphosphate nucleotidase CysQ [unclassified Roseitalea]|uniref:3'(2'),5'-bisphosphate nucleotidase CysQ n=1 Tax=unclassified Roseitalea TaxID=2639107 RepID=UPI00273E650F|nr:MULTISPECIES: 3'(2'),5'-bisphosphate nucleotidase CysQ [unclassified Roseitalea]